MKVNFHTQEEVFFDDRMTLCIRPQDFVHIALEPPLGGGQVLDIIVHRRLDTQERGLVVGLDVERIPSVDVVPIPNREIGSVLAGNVHTGLTSRNTSFELRQGPSARGSACLAVGSL